MDWKALLAYITGSVDQELRLRNALLWANRSIGSAPPETGPRAGLRDG